MAENKFFEFKPGVNYVVRILPQLDQFRDNTFDYEVLRKAVRDSQCPICDHLTVDAVKVVDRTHEPKRIPAREQHPDSTGGT